MEETPAEPRYELEVVWLHRPWWGLGLIGRFEELVAEPPPGTSFAEAQEWAERFRAAGASARIVQVA